MSDITRILSQIESGDPSAAEQLLPLVYEELRQLAAAKLAREARTNTAGDGAGARRLHPTRGCGEGSAVGIAWPFLRRRRRSDAADTGRGCAHKKSRKAGGDWTRLDLAQIEPVTRQPRVDILALDAGDRLEAQDSRKAALVKLRYFAGLTNTQAAAALNISTSTADNDWAYAKNWLRVEIARNASG